MTTSSVDSARVITRPPLLYLAALLMALALHWFWPMPILNDGIVIWVGSALAAFGIAIAMWGRRAMLAAGTNVDPTLPSTAISRRDRFG